MTKGATTFRNPSNGYTETFTECGSFFGCLFFGCLYWLVKGNIAHAFVSFVLACATGGISWLLYPFFAPGINKTYYLKRGWVIVDG